MRRHEVGAYLEREGVAHGKVGEAPAWRLSPYVSIWAAESLKSPGSVGSWGIFGDLPTDYVSAKEIKHPRDATHAIVALWKYACEYMLRSEKHPTFVIGDGDFESELAPILASRAETLLGWVDDPEFWEKDDL